MLSLTAIILMVIGTILTAFTIVLLVLGKKYDSWIEPLDSKEFPFCELYGIGFVFLDMIHFSYVTRGERKRRQQIALIYGEKHSEYYLRVNAAERMTFAILLTDLAFILYGLANDILIVGVLLMFAFTAYYYVSTLPETILQEKSSIILNEFADVVSKLALLVNAGMIMKEAWEKVAFTGKGELYTEMQRVITNINNGMSEVDAYTEFGTRCTSPEIKKFTSTVVQGLVKGNRELVEMIKQQSREIWDSKRHRVKQEGEKANSKLLIPICIMFVGILIMVIVPIFANLGV